MLAVETGGAYYLPVRLGKQLNIVLRLRLHTKIRFLCFNIKRHALRAEAEIVRLPAHYFQIIQQRSRILRLCADYFKVCVFHLYFVPFFNQINFLVILKVFIGFRTTLASFTVLHLFSAAFANCFFGSVFIRISVYATVMAIKTAT